MSSSYWNDMKCILYLFYIYSSLYLYANSTPYLPIYLIKVPQRLYLHYIKSKWARPTIKAK